MSQMRPLKHESVLVPCYQKHTMCMALAWLAGTYLWRSRSQGSVDPFTSRLDSIASNAALHCELINSIDTRIRAVHIHPQKNSSIEGRRLIQGRRSDQNSLLAALSGSSFPSTLTHLVFLLFACCSALQLPCTRQVLDRAATRCSALDAAPPSPDKTSAVRGN